MKGRVSRLSKSQARSLTSKRTRSGRARSESSANVVSPAPSKNEPTEPAEAFQAQEASTRPAMPNAPVFELPPPEHRWSAKAEGTGSVAWIATDFEAQARVAFDTEGPLTAEDQAHIDAARARVLAFAKDQVLLDWLDEPELERAWGSATRLIEQRGENVNEVVERAARNIAVARGEQVIGDQRSTGANLIIDGTESSPSSGSVHGVEDVLVPDLSLAGERKPTVITPAGGGATGVATQEPTPAPPGEIWQHTDGDVSWSLREGGDANAYVARAGQLSDQAPAPLVRVTGGALAEPFEPEPIVAPPGEIVQVTVTSGPLAHPFESEPFDPTKLVEHFYASLGADTRRGYKYDLEMFAEWRERTCGRTIDVAVALAELIAGGPGRANDVVLQWLAFMRENKLSPATRNRRLAAVKSALRYARLVGMIPWSIDVRGARVEKFRETAGPGMDAVASILASCSTDLSGLRDRAMLLLAVVLGMRRREIALASRRDYDVDRRRFFVRGKGEKDVWVSVPDEVAHVIAQWVAAWDAAHGAPADGFMFRSLSHRTFGKPITRKGVYLAVVAAGKRAGIKVWTHGLRHTGVTAALDETGGNIRAAQQFARHTDPRVTMKYDDNRVDLGGDAAKKIANKLTTKN